MSKAQINDSGSNCRECRFWEAQPDDKRVGICRRYPPSYDGWAMTDAHNWCGEFVSRGEATKRGK